MPADIALEVDLEALPHELKCFSFLLHAVQDEAFHGQGLAMLWKFFQDLVCCLDALFVLLRLIALDDRPEIAGILR